MPEQTSRHDGSPPFRRVCHTGGTTWRGCRIRCHKRSKP
jgi:hypothetical protein